VPSIVIPQPVQPAGALGAYAFVRFDARANGRKRRIDRPGDKTPIVMIADWAMVAP
jgi:hypothetical protein